MSHVTCHMYYVKCLCWSLGHAIQLLFSCLCSNVAVDGWKCQWFLAGNQLYDWSANRRGCCCQKKTIDIYTHKERHLSIDMKTKIVQHVPRINISIWHKTCDMRHVTCDIIINNHFWAYTWKQKLFRISKGSINMRTWLMTYDVWHVIGE